MVASCRRFDEVVDPSIEMKPSTRAIKRAFLTTLRCVDTDADKKPKMWRWYAYLTLMSPSVVRLLDALRRDNIDPTLRRGKLKLLVSERTNVLTNYDNIDYYKYNNIDFGEESEISPVGYASTSSIASGSNDLRGLEETIKKQLSDKKLLENQNPKVQASIAANTWVVSGSPQTKSKLSFVSFFILSPDKLHNLRRIAEQFQKEAADKVGPADGAATAGATVEDDDDVPDLVPGVTFEEVAATEEEKAKA
ncbi:hypothetical protein FCM35_KLT06603 [Carex littledalei]|uniref:NAC-A/B domain-containing protein n=1 Tax=Carex littledalei TaxID=544730 RepID=A0A833QVM8_9POAL|nr:hypothetical protein FCM35_KLT06603 [Carex littledalei]